MPDDPHTIDLLPDRDGLWSVCVMDEGGEVVEAVVSVPLTEAVGKATVLSEKYGVKYRVVNTPPRPDTN